MGKNVKVNTINLDFLAFVDAIQGPIGDHILYIGDLKFFYWVKLQNVFSRAFVRVQIFEFCGTILILSRRKLNLIEILINYVLPSLVCDSCSNFEILFVEVKSEVLSDSLRLLA